MRELRPGLWRWTARHPDWTPDDGGAEGWGPDVGCVYYEVPDAIVLVDPLVPRGEHRARFLDALDRDVHRAGRPVAVLLTTFWHERSAAELRARYPGSAVWAHELSVHRIDVEVTNPFRLGVPLPGSIEAHDATRRGGEVV